MQNKGSARCKFSLKWMNPCMIDIPLIMFVLDFFPVIVLADLVVIINVSLVEACSQTSAMLRQGSAATLVS